MGVPGESSVARYGSIFSLFTSALILIKSEPTPGFGHPFPYFLHFQPIPFNPLTANFNPVSLTASHFPQSFQNSLSHFPQSQFQNSQQFPVSQNNLVDQVSQIPAQVQVQNNSSSNKEFQQPYIADVRARLLKQKEQQMRPNTTQKAPTATTTNRNSNNGNRNTAKAQPLRNGLLRSMVNPNNDNNHNAIIPNDFDREIFQQNQHFIGFDNFRREQQQTEPTPMNTNANFPNNFVNNNFPWTDQNFGWGWSNVGWDYNNNVPSVSTQTPTDSAAPPEEDNSSPPVTDESGGMVRQRTSTTDKSSIVNNILLANSFNSTDIPELNEIPVDDPVAKFRRIVSQIREITRKELRT